MDWGLEKVKEGRVNIYIIENSSKIGMRRLFSSPSKPYEIPSNC
jgi:hypothetical protein